MSDNMFKDFCFDFYKLMKNISDKDISEIIEYNNKFRNRNRKKNILTDKLINLGIDITSYSFKIDYSIKILLNTFIKRYLHFLRIAEKCFIYNNDESNTIYSEINNDKEIIYFNTNESYKIRIIFERTKIPNNLRQDEDISDLFDNDYMEFITIEIKRNYGKQMVNKFKVITDTDKFDVETDSLLLEVILNEIYKAIINQYEDILNFIIRNYTKLNFHIDFENGKLKRFSGVKLL